MSTHVTWGELTVLIIIWTVVAPFVEGFIKGIWAGLRGGRKRRPPFM